MLKEICPTEFCTACMACLNACAHSAITVVEDACGYRYPKIDSEKCTNCGVCHRVCPELNRRTLTFPKTCYAAALKDTDELLKSASGGVGAALTRQVLEHGGIVIGCSGEDMRNVRHVIVRNLEDAHQLRGSKYVQSAIASDLFKHIRAELIKGTKVLFIGTGCQTAGLQNFLMKPYDNLIVVDLVCHGVPSQRMLNETFDYYIAKYSNIDPKHVEFRDKEDPKPNASGIRYGWISSTHTAQRLEPFYCPTERDPYMAAFLMPLNPHLRECCYSCRYSYSARQTDLTIFDFWGLRKDSSLTGRPGVSAVLINTSKGEKIFDSLKDVLDVERREIQEAVAGNHNLQFPSVKSPLRAQFMKRCATEGFVAASETIAIPAQRRLKQKAKIIAFIKAIISR